MYSTKYPGRLHGYAALQLSSEGACLNQQKAVPSAKHLERLAIITRIPRLCCSEYVRALEFQADMLHFLEWTYVPACGKKSFLKKFRYMRVGSLVEQHRGPFQAGVMGGANLYIWATDDMVLSMPRSGYAFRGAKAVTTPQASNPCPRLTNPKVRYSFSAK